MAGKQTLSEQIYHELYQDITRQRLVCGEKLTLKALKDRFQVSHTPIREALTRLSENGLVTYYSNCGVTVTSFTEPDIRELFQFTSELDAMAIQFCKNSFSQAPLVFELQQLIETSGSLLEQGRVEDWKEYSEQFHVVFYRHAQNEYLNQAARRVRAKVEVLSCMYYHDGNVERIQGGHEEIYQAVRAGDFDRASQLMRLHLQDSMVYALTAYQAAEAARQA